MTRNRTFAKWLQGELDKRCWSQSELARRSSLTLKQAHIETERFLELL